MLVCVSSQHLNSQLSRLESWFVVDEIDRIAQRTLALQAQVLCYAMRLNNVSIL